MQIKISEILNDLTNGQTRADIKEKYNLSTAQMKMLFQHPQLKGRKTKKVEEPIEILDDVSQPESSRQTHMEFSEETVRPDVQENDPFEDDFM